jgi:hypothetical protein
MLSTRLAVGSHTLLLLGLVVVVLLLPCPADAALVLWTAVLGAAAAPTACADADTDVAGCRPADSSFCLRNGVCAESSSERSLPPLLLMLLVPLPLLSARAGLSLCCLTAAIRGLSRGELLASNPSAVLVGAAVPEPAEFDRLMAALSMLKRCVGDTRCHTVCR